MKRPILIFARGVLCLVLTSCSINLAASPTPVVFPSSIPSLSSTASLATPATPAAGLTTPPSALTSTPPAPGHYAVIRIASNNFLNIRSAPGLDHPVIGTFLPNATAIQRTGASTMVGTDLWVQVQNPSGGIGWVSARYLTEYVPSATFCTNNRVNILLSKLGSALTAADSDQIASLVSPAHGMDVRLYRNGTLANYDRVHALFIFISTVAIDWGPAPGSGLETIGSFRGSVLPILQQVFKASYTLDCDLVQTGGASYDTSWPGEYAHI